MNQQISEDTDPVLDVLIIGAGPIGLACAVEARRKKLSYLVVEKGCLVNSFCYYPTYMKFFSTPDLLEIGDVPFITEDEKPSRREAMNYYRRISLGLNLDVHLYEEVLDVEGEDGNFRVITTNGEYRAAKVITAIGYFHHPRMLKVPGENLFKVSHYYQEAHLYSDQDLLVVGGGNSAVEAALDCYRQGARVSLAVRDSEFHEGLKYWIRPDIENRIKKGEITAYFNTQVLEIKPSRVVLETKNKEKMEISNDFVLAMTGYEPDFEFLGQIGVESQGDIYQTPKHNSQTYETNRKGLYLAGVVVGGKCTSKWFIENSRAHAGVIMKHLTS